MTSSTPPLNEQKAPSRLDRLGDYLVENGRVSREAVDISLQEQRVTGERLGSILVRSGFLTRKDLVQAILTIAPDKIHGEELYNPRVPVSALESTRSILVADADGLLYVGTLGSEWAARMALAPYFPNHQIEFVPVRPEQLDNYLARLQGLQTDDSNIVERLVREALMENASDIHILPKTQSYTVFFRILGVLEPASDGPLDEYQSLVSRIKDLARMDIAERRLPQDGGFQMEYSGRYIDLRVATLPTVDGETVVMRLLDPDNVRPSLEGLGISRVGEWRRGISYPDGLCLICGPTGSGKTTTLNASIREQDRLGKAIFSAEDPVEYRQAYVRQVNVNPSIGLDFNRALRSFMREDPDVIILGEIRDLETAQMSLRAAETGHLVLATLHTDSIHGAYARLRDIGLKDYELRYLLRSVLVQRLVRTLCPHCGGAGCAHCHGKGYAGRQVVSECAYFENDEEVNRMFQGERGWPTMREDAAMAVLNGVTDEREIVRVFGPEILHILQQVRERPIS